MRIALIAAIALALLSPVALAQDPYDDSLPPPDDSYGNEDPTAPSGNESLNESDFDTSLPPEDMSYLDEEYTEPNVTFDPEGGAQDDGAPTTTSPATTSPGATTPATTTDKGAPGFAMIVALVGLGVTALALRRR